MKSLMVIDINNEVMKEQNAERLSEYEKAQIEFAKGKAREMAAAQKVADWQIAAILNIGQRAKHP